MNNVMYSVFIDHIPAWFNFVVAMYRYVASCVINIVEDKTANADGRH